MGTFDHSSRGAFLRSHTDVGQEGPPLSPRSNSSQRCSIGVEVRTLYRQVHPHQTPSSMSLWTLLCALVHSHVGTGRGHPQTVPTNLGAWNCPTHHNSPLHQTLHLAQCSQTSTVLLTTTKPRLVHQIARWRSAIRHSRECVSTALESSGGVLYTTASDALHCTC